MPPRVHPVLQHAVEDRIPHELIAAKIELRDRLVPRVERQLPLALSIRRVRRYQPAQGVNLVGVGIGEKVTDGARTGVLCVKVLVAKKFPKGQVPHPERIPESINGIPTDVEGVGYPRKFVIPNQLKQRPVLGGVSGSPSLRAAGYRFAGTLGVVLARRTEAGALYFLSNNHVLADENRIPLESAIVQPASLDGGKESDHVAELAAFAPLHFDNKRNWMDAAIAKIDARTSKTILGIGPLTGAGAPSLNLLVRKAGRTTGLTEGIVRIIRFDVVDVQYDQGMVRVDDVMVIENTTGPFSRPGDSGSAIVDARGRVIGLLFAGSDVVTYAIPIRRILRRFKLRVAVDRR